MSKELLVVIFRNEQMSDKVGIETKKQYNIRKTKSNKSNKFLVKLLYTWCSMQSVLLTINPFYPPTIT